MPPQQDINAARDRHPLCISHCHSVEVPTALILSLFHHCILVEYVCWTERMRGGLGSFFYLVCKLPGQMQPHVLLMECWAYHSEILDPELATVTGWTLGCLSWDGEWGFFVLFIYLFIYLFMAVLGLRFCARAFSSCGKRGPLFIAVHGPLTIAASPIAEHRLQTRRLSSCGSRA